MAGAAGAFVGVLVLWGGYGLHWRWTGLGADVTLWDWLHLLLLPLAVAVVPLWARHRGKLDRRRRLLLLGAFAVFGLFVVLGYTLDLTWTGFPGNRLWDWLELLVLPLAVATFPVWRELSEGPRTRHKFAALAVVVLFGILILGGYGLGWSWTGFQGNTFFDWLQLLVAPIALPLLLSPAVKTWMTTGLESEPEPPPAPLAAAPAPEASSPA